MDDLQTPPSALKVLYSAIFALHMVALAKTMWTPLFTNYIFYANYSCADHLMVFVMQEGRYSIAGQDTARPLLSAKNSFGVDDTDP